MNAAEVVERKVQSQCGFVVVPLFRETVGQSSHSLDKVSHGAVLSFGVRCADPVIVWCPGYPFFADGLYCGRAVLPLVLFRGLAEYLDQHPVVHSAAQQDRYGCLVGREAVCGQLEVSCRGVSQSLAEQVRIGLGSLAKVPSHHEFRIPLHGRKAPRVARVFGVALLLPGLFLAEHRCPDFVRLNIVDVDLADFVLQEPLAAFADENEQVQDRLQVGIRQASRGPNARPFHQMVNHLDSPINADPHSAQQKRIVSKGSAAVPAAKALFAVDLPVFPSSFVVTYSSDHRESSQGWGDSLE